jgi:hypothetical protein
MAKGLHAGRMKGSAGKARKGDVANTTRKPPPVKAGVKSTMAKGK